MERRTSANPPVGKEAIMSHRRFGTAAGFFLTCICVAGASAQTPERQMTLSERMAAMRRGWSGEEASRQQIAVQQTPASGSQEESGSIWSNFLGRKPNKPQAQPATRPAGPSAVNSRLPQQYQARQTTIQSAPVRNTAAQARTAIPQTNAYPTAQSRNGSFTLPGLGGSPLPGSKASLTQSSAAGASPSSHQVTGEYPVVGNGPLTHPKSALNHSHVGRQTPPLQQAQAGATSRPSSQRSAPRQSPSQRPAPKVDPDQLRRELAGSYPVMGAKDEPAARTAQVSEPTVAGTSDQTTANVDVSTSEPAAQTTEPTPEIARPGISAATDTAASNDEASPVVEATEEMTLTDTIPSETPAMKSSVALPDYRSAFGEGFANQTPRNKDRETTSTVGRPRAAFGESAPAMSDDPTVLVSNETPVITTDIRGPKQIVMGREATYRVQLRNQSDAAAEGIVASIRIPSSAEVVDTSTTQGMIQQPRGASAPGQLEWQLSRLEPRASETLDIKLIPRASRPLELGVSWTLSPVGSRAVVQVQEPKLQMSVSGPDEVLFSEPQMFRLTLTNPGTGTAENVKIDLIPPGDGAGAVTSHTIGDLPPGAIKTVDVELTAREAGKLFVRASATAEGDLTSDASKEIFCRKPELEVDWRGPDTKYAGTPATYFIRVRNPGTAPADDVTVSAVLPDGAEFASASDGQLYDSKKRQVTWEVGTLSPGDDNYMELKCVVNTPGVNLLRIDATSSTSDLVDEKVAETNVVALADLKLDVTDPSGPVAVGEQAVYEIRVQNRGANTANDVNIVALFSEGIEPDQVEGAMYTVSDGRVTFRAIEELQAGREIVVRIRARAVQAGTHVFRAEVLCRDLEIKLAAEETTRFYADEVPPATGDIADEAATPSDGFQAASQ
jgi:uncharacterized repeat protein (TIGR01451 family)